MVDTSTCLNSSVASSGPRIDARVVARRVLVGGTAVLLLVSVYLLDVLVARAARHAPGLPAWLADLFSRGSAIPLVFLGMALYGARELDRLLRGKSCRPFFSFALASIAALMLLPWLSAAGLLGNGPAAVEGLYPHLVCMVLVGVGICAMTVLRGATTDSMRDAAATFFLIIYVGLMPSFAIQIRASRMFAEQDGAGLLLITLLTIKASDIGGFLAGSRWGRHKLIPSISPGKSVEGAIGGLVASVAVAVGTVLVSRCLEHAPYEWGTITLFGRGLDLLAPIEIATRAFSRDPLTAWLTAFPRAVLFGVAMSLFGQLGDIVESCFKRDAGAKDSGRAIPASGGILDLIDSPLVAIPVGWVMLTSLWGG